MLHARFVQHIDTTHTFKNSSCWISSVANNGSFSSSVNYQNFPKNRAAYSSLLQMRNLNRTSTSLHKNRFFFERKYSESASKPPPTNPNNANATTDPHKEGGHDPLLELGMYKPKPLKETLAQIPKDAAQWMRKTFTVQNMKETFTRVTSREYLRSLPGKFYHSMQHYWLGTKLLALDIKTSVMIIARILYGRRITRRERRQLQRTMKDMLRVLPFSVFVIVPMLELTLPIVLKLFPNMLPSTFETASKKSEDTKKKLHGRVMLAKFLQETVTERIPKSTEMFEEFMAFMKKVRAGEPVENTDILRFASLFQDEITLDNISRAQLVAMCKYMGVPAYGSDTILRLQLGLKLRALKRDDRLIQNEGVESLTVEELQSALRARGLKGTSTVKSVLQKRLNEWLDLSLNHNLPESLLILSRAFIITQKESTKEALKDVISTLPDEVVDELRLKMNEKASPEERLEVLEKQNEYIADEREDEQEEAEERERKKKEKEQLEAQESVTHSLKPEQMKDLGDVLAMLITDASLDEAYETVRRINRELVELSETTSADFEDQITQLGQEFDDHIHNLEYLIGVKLNEFDPERNASISLQELHRSLGFLREKIFQDKLHAMVAQLDRNEDGSISIQKIIETTKVEDISLQAVTTEGISDPRVREEVERIMDTCRNADQFVQMTQGYLRKDADEEQEDLKRKAKDEEKEPKRKHKEEKDEKEHKRKAKEEKEDREEKETKRKAKEDKDEEEKVSKRKAKEDKEEEERESKRKGKEDKEEEEKESKRKAKEEKEDREEKETKRKAKEDKEEEEKESKRKAKEDKDEEKESKRRPKEDKEDKEEKEPKRKAKEEKEDKEDKEPKRKGKEDKEDRDEKDKEDREERESKRRGREDKEEKESKRKSKDDVEEEKESKKKGKEEREDQEEREAKKKGREDKEDEKETKKKAKEEKEEKEDKEAKKKQKEDKDDKESDKKKPKEDEKDKKEKAKDTKKTSRD